MSYRGHLIRYNPILDTFWVEREGVNLTHATSEDDARRKIDELLGIPRPR